MLVPPVVCLVTSRRAVAPDARTLRDALADLDRQIDAAMEAGIDLVQVREPGIEAGALRDFVARLVGRAPASTRVVVNDRADVARVAGAHGVHLRADGPPASAVRGLVGPRWVVGRSVHAAGEARSASDADYLIYGTTFPSRSKGPGAPVGGVEGLAAVVADAAVPVLAIGGITPERVRACRAAGAAGVAAIGLFLPQNRTPESLGPAEAVRALRQRWHEAA